mmetsp:Transcript_22429/g.44445  ORF Transcript_22429/g.44445 Transcript_22429/m.44445 type:complete len:95 (-) Transcript_22429:260-544(-)
MGKFQLPSLITQKEENRTGVGKGVGSSQNMHACTVIQLPSTLLLLSVLHGVLLISMYVWFHFAGIFWIWIIPKILRLLISLTLFAKEVHDDDRH